MFKSLKNISLTVFLSALACNQVAAAVITYTDFSDTSSLQFNGDASLQGDDLSLTSGLFSSGSVFSTDSITLDTDLSFSAFFKFTILNSIGSGDTDGPGADGLVFALQGNSNTAGGDGSSLGFGGLADSLGIEFDPFTNRFDPSGNHVGVNTNGSVNSISTFSEPERFNNGQDWFAWIDYDGVADELFVRYNTTTVKPTDAVITESIDLTGVFGTNEIFIGFTSGTGAGGGDHLIDRLSFSTEFNDSFEVSAPGSILLLSLSLVGLFFSRRKVPHFD